MNAECMLKGLGLTEEFSALVIGAECERAKPFPDPYLKGLEELGIEAHEAIAFEDSPSGRLLPTVVASPSLFLLCNGVSRAESSLA